MRKNLSTVVAIDHIAMIQLMNTDDDLAPPGSAYD
jgi:hypothetical protein